MGWIVWRTEAWLSAWCTRLAIPVMLVKGAASPEVVQRFGSAEPVLVVPLDGSELAEAAVPVATQLAIATRARIVLLSIVPA